MAGYFPADASSPTSGAMFSPYAPERIWAADELSALRMLRQAADKLAEARSLIDRAGRLDNRVLNATDETFGRLDEAAADVRAAINDIEEAA